MLLDEQRARRNIAAHGAEGRAEWRALSSPFQDPPIGRRSANGFVQRRGDGDYRLVGGDGSLFCRAWLAGHHNCLPSECARDRQDQPAGRAGDSSCTCWSSRWRRSPSWSSAWRYPVAIWIEVDAGSGRSGVAWDDGAAICLNWPAIVERQQTAAALQGLLTHAGKPMRRTAEAMAADYNETTTRMQRHAQLADGVRLLGLELSIGDTPACSMLDDWGDVDEIGPAILSSMT